MSEWQPIDTAPKDGRIILLYTPRSGGFVLDHYGAGYWDLPEPNWPWGKWFHVMEGEPTHWMPLPPDPKEQA